MDINSLLTPRFWAFESWCFFLGKKKWQKNSTSTISVMQSWEDDNTFCRVTQVRNSSQHQYFLWVTSCFPVGIPHFCLMSPSGKDLPKSSHMILSSCISVTMPFSGTKASFWARTTAKKKTSLTHSYQVHLCFSNPPFATFLATTVNFKQNFQQRKYQLFGELKKKWLSSKEL